MFGATKVKVVPLVETRHIDYVETLFNRLTAAKESLAKREEYVRSVAGLGVKSEAAQRVANIALEEGRNVHAAEATLNRIRMVLNLGAEPTTPPITWFCGHIEEPKRVKVRTSWGTDRRYPEETWDARRPYSRATLVFGSAIPAEALQRYAATKPYIDDARIYSPREEDFEKKFNPVPRDPVLIGKISFLGKDEFFEIARWDIDEDLAALFSRL